ncbi:hypothetical protein NLM59_07530 [Weeksellaceae bacterium KMM 9724]|uniref:hypothetical protein n=1 Tax=Profundicola chukchiensis TaxID=2961959 RepID=UPI00243A4D17|nr:hypothetical protein [Profundicola chukchiensis]MDG4950772.1 hypothetical protein [Profundicola chukchiensis]
MDLSQEVQHSEVESKSDVLFPEEETREQLVKDDNHHDTSTNSAIKDKKKEDLNKSSNNSSNKKSYIVFAIGALFILAYWYYDSYMKQVDIGSSVIFKVYENHDQDIVAVPIALYTNQKIFLEPPYTMDDEATFELSKLHEGHDSMNAHSIADTLSNVISKADSLYLLENGRRIGSIAIKGKTLFHLSDPGYISAKLDEKPKSSILTDNPIIGTNRIKDIEDLGKPELESRKDGEGNLLDDTLIAQIDIDGDGIPELIYECSTYEGSFYKIFSYANGTWYMIYSGTYLGY